MIIHDFIRSQNAFNYTFKRKLKGDETIIIKVPPVAPNKRGINDIGWQTNSNDVVLYATIDDNPEQSEMWSELMPEYVVNKTASYLKVHNNGSDEAYICIRIIMC